MPKSKRRRDVHVQISLTKRQWELVLDSITCRAYRVHPKQREALELAEMEIAQAIGDIV